MQTNEESQTKVGDRVYFKEKNIDEYYIGTVIGRRNAMHITTNIFGGDRKEWQDTLLLIETSDGQHIQRWITDTFEAKDKGRLA